MPSGKWKKRLLDLIYIRKRRFEIQERKENPIQYTGTKRPISSTGHTVQYYGRCGVVQVHEIAPFCIRLQRIKNATAVPSEL
jgi:hypothetical protein